VKSSTRCSTTAQLSDGELQNARALLLQEISLSESSVDSIAQDFLSRTELDLPLDEPILAAQRYLELTTPQVQSVFAKWIRQGGFVQVSEGPAPE
jgi:zinc protease